MKLSTKAMLIVRASNWQSSRLRWSAPPKRWSHPARIDNQSSDKLHHRLPAQLSQAAEHELFKSHSPHLPKSTLRAVYVQSAVAVVIKGHSHLKHSVPLIVAHRDCVLAQAEDDRLLQLAGHQTDRYFGGILTDRKLVGSVLRPQRVAGFNVPLDLRS